MAGVLTLPLLANGAKIAMEVEDVGTGERRALAEGAAIGEGTANLAWKFDAAGLEWGTQVLRAATPCDVLVIDELGPLELIHDEGWGIAMDLLQAGNYRDALVVVRPGLLENFQTRLKHLDVQVFIVTPSDREELFKQIVQNLDPRNSANPHESE